MRIHAKCPACAHTLRLDQEKAGKRVRCPQCYRLFRIPALEKLRKALSVLEQAAATVYVDQDGNIYA